MAKTMTVREMIEKFKLESTTRNSEPAIRIGVTRKPTDKQMAALKAAKAEILAELVIVEEEKRQAWEIQKAAIEANRKKREEEYLAANELRRCLICEQDEYMNIRHYIRFLVYSEDNRAFTPEFGEVRHVELAHVTPVMEAIMKGKNRYYGIQAASWEIAPEQEEKIMAEYAKAKEAASVEALKKHREEAEKKAAKEAKAREITAEKEREITRITNTTKPHQGPKGTCGYCGKPGARWQRQTAAGVKYACEEAPGMVYAAAPSAEQSEGRCLAKLMREHEAWAKREGLVRCWECGIYRRPEELDREGYCGC